MDENTNTIPVAVQAAQPSPVAATAPASEPSDADFMGVDDTRLADEIARAGERIRNKYLVRFPNLVVLAPSGRRYRLPLNPERDLIESLRDDSAPADIISKLLESVDPEQTTFIGREGSSTLVSMFNDYMKVIERVQDASVGKSSTSSPASAKTE